MSQKLWRMLSAFTSPSVSSFRLFVCLFDQFLFHCATNSSDFFWALIWKCCWVENRSGSSRGLCLFVLFGLISAQRPPPFTEAEQKCTFDVRFAAFTGQSDSHTAPRVIFTHSLSKCQWSFPWPPFICWIVDLLIAKVTIRLTAPGNDEEGKERQRDFAYCNFIAASRTESQWAAASPIHCSSTLGVISVAALALTPLWVTPKTQEGSSRFSRTPTHEPSKDHARILSDVCRGQ